MKTTYIYIIVVVVIAIGLLLFYAHPKVASDTGEASETGSVVATPEDDFAQCLSDAGAKFYGAFWCPHCQKQKALFKESKKLPYIECSTPDGEGQTLACTNEGITGYPTWKFTNGTELTGEQEFAALAEKTGCAVPQI